MRDVHEKQRMKDAVPEEQVVCPESGTGRSQQADKVWKTATGDTMGTIKPHRHWMDKVKGEDCPWSGFPVKVKYVPKKIEEPKSSPPITHP